MSWWAGPGKDKELSSSGVSAVEQLGNDNFEKFVGSFETFSGDLNLVGHPRDNRMLPWGEVKRGQYNLSSLNGVNKTTLAKELLKVTDVAVVCEDKDVSSSYHNAIRASAGHNTKTFFLSFAGGIVQSEGERRDSLDFIGDYLYNIRRIGGMPNLRTVWASGHDHGCGAVAYFIKNMMGAGDKIPLPSFLGDKLNENYGDLGGIAEQAVMAALVRGGAEKYWQLAQLVGLNTDFRLNLVDIDRRGSFEMLPLNPTGKVLRVEDLGAIESYAGMIIQSVIAEYMRGHR